ncbi:MAG: dTDP-4-dehydrorhamnose reductase [Ahrensia sp.]|nr:dTDP-4-dehydrorhamnose reductase [Ahrensia sp.]
MRIVVTGREGQVARALAECCATRDDIDLVHAARPDFDMTRPETIASQIAFLRPDIVVNAAAYTAVDQAESEPNLAMTINAIAAGEVARGARLRGVPVIQISTDYVFDGTLGRPYRETDPVSPLGVYGRTKLAGEKAVAEANPDHVILRTSWVYSPFGKNFVKTMLRLAETKDEIGVVSDQVGNPTSAFVIAEGVLSVIAGLIFRDRAAFSGAYHLAGQGSASWYDVACAIFDSAGPHLDKVPVVKPITTADYPTPAKRPADSRLDTTRFEADFGYQAPDWRMSLSDVLARLSA